MAPHIFRGRLLASRRSCVLDYVLFTCPSWGREFAPLSKRSDLGRRSKNSVFSNDVVADFPDSFGSVHPGQVEGPLSKSERENEHRHSEAACEPLKTAPVLNISTQCTCVYLRKVNRVRFPKLTSGSTLFPSGTFEMCFPADCRRNAFTSWHSIAQAVFSFPSCMNVCVHKSRSQKARPCTIKKRNEKMRPI